MLCLNCLYLSSICSSGIEEDVVDASTAEEDPDDTEKSVTSDPSTTCCVELPPPRTERNDETGTVAGIKLEEKREVVEKYCNDGQTSAGRFDDAADTTNCHAVSCAAQAVEVSRQISVRATVEEGESDEGEEGKVEGEINDSFRGREERQGIRPEMPEAAVEDREEEEHENQTQGGGTEQDDTLCGMRCEVWDEIQEAVCELIEDEESQAASEGATGERDVTGDAVKAGEEEEQTETEKAGVLCKEKKTSEEDDVAREDKEEDVIIRTEDKTEAMEELLEALVIEEDDPEMQLDVEIQEIISPKKRSKEADGEIQLKRAIKEEEKMQLPKHNRETGDSEEQEKESKDKRRAPKEQLQTLSSVDDKEKGQKEVKQSDELKSEESDSGQGAVTGVDRKLVASKQPAHKVYQVKSVPVVPPKPQHCRLTALSLRQQQQQQRQRERRSDAENSLRVTTEQDKSSDREAKAERDKASAGEQGKDGAGEHESVRGKRERQVLKGGEREKRREGDEGGTRDATRNSPLSMCFDEAVAIATMRRGREKESEKERERQWDWGHEVQ